MVLSHGSSQNQLATRGVAQKIVSERSMSYSYNDNTAISQVNSSQHDMGGATDHITFHLDNYISYYKIDPISIALPNGTLVTATMA
ncbi:hypothetical protein Lal_00032303 [Lupinus albus]|nr:hypothetical protein Lal_00032303 [Lupinus albus]